MRRLRFLLPAITLVALIRAQAPDARQIAQERAQAELEVPKLVQVLELQPGMTVADVGAGGGAMSVVLAATATARGAAGAAQSTPPAQLLQSSTTICVQSADSRLEAAVADRLTAWGRLRVVPRPDESDLVLEVSEKRLPEVSSDVRPDDPPGRRYAVRLRHRRAGRELWSATKGDGPWGDAGNAAFAQRATTWRAREIAREFVKYFDKMTRTATR